MPAIRQRMPGDVRSAVQTARRYRIGNSQVGTAQALIAGGVPLVVHPVAVKPLVIEPSQLEQSAWESEFADASVVGIRPSPPTGYSRGGLTSLVAAPLV
ncbi:hypothetical protein FYK55_09995 [Roseiconus nitratireducens]|uniref:Uncharacterized protein n=1 Tax=Roseiconus nitratireducens TaxID=2605748 RepID=A0A5M6DAQ7_9BACT|nr:hypothetical protein [Roseiconus nitratireducens]KAA5544631.1 hypothetical protein FYK55_09995 [Roseiconus nitratireducens]